MTEQAAQGTGLAEIILVFGIVLIGFRIMLGRATVPVLVIITLCLVAGLFPNDPLARMVTGLTCQLAVPLTLLWGFYHFLLKPLIEPRGNRNTK